MPASGSSLFSDADGYEASLQDVLDLLALSPRDFQLASLPLLRAQGRRNLARAKLLGIGRVLTSNGFTIRHHFVTEYWRVHGEMPPIPPSGGIE